MAGELLCPGVLVYKMVTMGGFKAMHKTFVLEKNPRLPWKSLNRGTKTVVVLILKESDGLRSGNKSRDGEVDKFKTQVETEILVGMHA